ncbi:unnamed protein product [Prunus armeniaca]
MDESAQCSPTSNEPKRVEDHGKCPGIIAAGAQCRADHKPDVALFPVEEESVPGQLLLPLECVE